jgi:hypothetical protein
MASFGFRARTRSCAFLLALLAASGACTTTATPQAVRSVEPQPPSPAFAAGVELPAGPGREILIASCLGCHELAALPLFKGFYTRESWQTLVLTMKEHGAEVDGAEIEVLADYLAQHFGPGSP